MRKIDIIMPVYNEPVEIVSQTISRLLKLQNGNIDINIIVVDDGSNPPLEQDSLKKIADINIIKHEENRGYGSALKTGIKSSDAPWIGIIDADGTYPVEDFNSMFNYLDNADMIVGVRTGDINEIPALRRVPKAFLNNFASYLANARIVDLNSGMRIFRRSLANYLWELFPTGFSFTSTITMGAILGNYVVVNHQINYYKREGKSSIHPIKDTLRFFRLILRLGLLFSPAKIFAPVAGVLFFAGICKGFFRDYLLLGYIGNLAVILMLGSVQIVMMGFIAELIVHSRKLSNK